MVLADRVSNHSVAFAAAENRSASGPGIRGETSARDWITQSECAKGCADRAFMIRVVVNEYFILRIEKQVESGLLRIEDKSFHSDAEIAVKEKPDVAATAPGVVAAEIFVETAKDRVAFGRALNQVRNIDVRIDNPCP